MNSSLIFGYKSTLSEEYWSKYLERDLLFKEKLILYDAKLEIRENKKLKKIHNNAKKKGLYIKELTEMNGNCLFESLCIIGLCDDIDTLKKATAVIAAIVEDVDLETELGLDLSKVFKIDGLSGMTPRKFFNLTNDIPYVYCRTRDMLYMYTYQTMCRDIYNCKCWYRINTELILRILAIVLQIRFRIFHTTDYISEISHPEPNFTFNLGLMGEFHYVPLAYHECENDINKPCPKYKNSKRFFHKWASKMSYIKGDYK